MATGSSNIENNDTVCGIILQGGGIVRLRDLYVNSNMKNEPDFSLPVLIKTFSGRDKELKQLASLFFKENKTKIVICGIPGIGKSELAKQFAKKCEDEGTIHKTYWIKSENESEFRESLIKIKRSYETSNVKESLFILDNGISRKKLSECGLELSDKFYFLITSPIKNWGNDIEPFELKPLHSDLAANFYKTYLKQDYKDKDRNLFIKLANLVGCIPLGLQITAAYVHRAKQIYGEKYLQIYVNELEESQNEIIEKDFPSSADNPYDKSLYRAISISLNKVAFDKEIQAPDVALCALYISSYLNPENIECNILLHVLYNFNNLLKCTNRDANMLKEALYILDNLSLITYNPKTTDFIIHRFTQKMIRYHLTAYHTKMQKECYRACLEATFFGNDTFTLHRYSLHFPSVLQYIEENLTTITNFFSTYKEKIFKDASIFMTFWKIFDKLVQCGCIKYIKSIFDDLGDIAKAYIIKFELLKTAVDCDQLKMFKLLLKYVDANSTDYVNYSYCLPSAQSDNLPYVC